MKGLFGLIVLFLNLQVSVNGKSHLLDKCDTCHKLYNQCVLLDDIPAYTVEWVILNKDYLFEEHVHRSRLGTRLGDAWILVVVVDQPTTVGT